MKILIVDKKSQKIAEEAAEVTGLVCTKTERDDAYLLAQEGTIRFIPSDNLFKPVTFGWLSLMDSCDVRIFRTKKDLLYRAVGLKNGLNSIVDVTTGMGWDALSLWCMNRWGGSPLTVHAVERNPIVYSLLLSSFRQLEDHGYDCSGLAIHFSEARDFLLKHTQESRPDVVFLDPMFTEKKKKSLPRKEMQVFREIVGDDLDSEDLLNQALEVAKKRVVVKRPIKAPSLRSKEEQVEPQSIQGKLIRYDIYMK